jgi:hypothetical protein
LQTYKLFEGFSDKVSYFKSQNIHVAIDMKKTHSGSLVEFNAALLVHMSDETAKPDGAIRPDSQRSVLQNSI